MKQIITLCTFYVSCPPPSVVPALVVCASTHDICASGFDFVPGIIVPYYTRASVMVRSNAITMRPTITTFHPFLRIACAWPRAGVGFCGGWDRLTCCRCQLIFEGVDLSRRMRFSFCDYCVGEGGVVGNGVTHVVGKDPLCSYIVCCGRSYVVEVPLDCIHHLMVRFGSGIGRCLPESHFLLCHCRASKRLAFYYPDGVSALIGGVGLPVYGLPILPHTLIRAALIPFLRLVRILVGAKHCKIYNCDEGFVGDGEVHSFGAGL